MGYGDFQRRVARTSSTTPTRDPTFALSLLEKITTTPVRVNVFSSWHELDETVVSGGARARERPEAPISATSLVKALMSSSTQ